MTGTSTKDTNETPHLNISVIKICETKLLSYFYPQENEDISLLVIVIFNFLWAQYKFN